MFKRSIAVRGRAYCYRGRMLTQRSVGVPKVRPEGVFFIERSGQAYKEASVGDWVE